MPHTCVFIPFKPDSSMHFLGRGNKILKLISLNKGNYNHDVLWISDPTKHRFLWFYQFVVSFCLVSSTKLYQTLEIVYFTTFPNTLKFVLYINSLLSISKCVNAQSTLYCVQWKYSVCCTYTVHEVTWKLCKELLKGFLYVLYVTVLPDIFPCFFFYFELG